MNKVFPNKLLNSKWTAVKPANKERHFMVTDVHYGENREVLSCEIEAVVTKRSMPIDWHELTDSSLWLQGWK